MIPKISQLFSEDVKFAKQFLIAPTSFSNSFLEDWITYPLRGDLLVYIHPHAATHIKKSSNSQFVVIGTVLDPNSPSANNLDIIERLASAVRSFEELELHLSTLGGRCIFIVTLDRKTRIYHDAAGLKPVYFLKSSNHCYVASQPSLLHFLGVTERNVELENTFLSHKNSGSWPIHQTPFSRVKQLIPNHFLDLDQFSTHRYWPKAHPASGSIDEVALEMRNLLQGLLQAAVNRKNCLLNLTGGYDSRMVLSSCIESWPKIYFLTTMRDDSPHYDQSIPKRMAKKFNLNHDIVLANHYENEGNISNSKINSILQSNVGDMFLDGSTQVIKTIWKLTGDKLHLPGLVSEVFRCFYYSGGEHPANFCGEDIAKIAGFPANPIAIEGFSEWLQCLPENNAVNTLDLLYWEHRLGVWASCGLSYREAILDQIPPMNCRRFLELGLSVPVSVRQEPYLLVRKIIALSDPALLEFPFNEDWFSRNQALVQKLPIPWKYKKALHWV